MKIFRRQQQQQPIVAALLTAAAAFLVPFFGSSSSVVHAQQGTGGGGDGDTIVDLIVNDPELTTLVSLVLDQAPFIVDVLSGPGPFTLFAPINSAFVEGVVDDVPSGLLATVLLYHAASGQVLSTQITDGLEVQTLQLEDVQFNFGGDDGGSIFINDLGSQVLQPDILASNGVVHKIGGSPLVPQVVLNNLVGLGPAGPTPAQQPTPAPIPPTPVPAPIEGSVVDVAVDLVQQGQPFETLVNLVVLAGLAVPLSEIDEVTVLAPVDDAFGALPTDLVQSLLTDPYTLHLQEILLYHTTPTTSLSSNLLNSASVLSQSGLFLTSLNKQEDRVQYIAASAGGVGGLRVNGDVEIVAADVPATNGLIHGIDSVLLPSFVSKTVVDVVVEQPFLETLQTLVIQAGLVDVLSGEGPFTVFAPTNVAFLNDVGEDPQLDLTTLTEILTYHVVVGMYPSTEITDGLELTTVQGETIEFAIDDTTGVTSIVFETAGGVERSVPILTDPAPTPDDPIWIVCQSTSPPSICDASDLLAINGVVHRIGGVLVPPTIGAADEDDDEEEEVIEPGLPTSNINPDGTATTNNVMPDVMNSMSP
eukprot:CAMPEP_0113460568 /NCGR_PEP_ID=MMETSP0014_2-20120614/11061_1 /TAXON_ID=2857 /ORGANISM="Nitzschia sp." /LENGTH=588 /DNA_ID=CAMNT_0000352239 /DNA_START=314 /DNA_END=2080 /DNA_ORIENTATION=- /assembly_acc=CAM_ASM_000159